MMDEEWLRGVSELAPMPVSVALASIVGTGVTISMLRRWLRGRRTPGTKPEERPQSNFAPSDNNVCSSKNKPRLRATSIGTTRYMASGLIPNQSVHDPVINVVIAFNTVPSTDSLKQLFMDAIVPYDRFHSIPYQTCDSGPIAWISQKLDVHQHFFEHKINVDVDMLEKEGFPPTVDGGIHHIIEQFLNSPLRTKRDGRPWWEVHVISSSLDDTRTTNDKQKSGAVLIRIHHAIGDGVSLTELFADVIVDDVGSPIASQNIFSPSRGSPHTANKHKRSTVVSRAMAGLRYGVSALTSLAHILEVMMFGHDSVCSVLASFRINRTASLSTSPLTV